MRQKEERKRKYFFTPRIGCRYSEKWNGYYTMVVGSHLICKDSCEFKSLCTTSTQIWEMEDCCPRNKNRQSETYYSLSNSSRVQIDTYIADRANYSDHTTFTRYMLEERGYVSSEKREEFWERVVFYNFLQHYLSNGEIPNYNDNKSFFNENIEAFKQVLKAVEPQPQLIYVWSKSVADALRANISKIEGLREILMETEVQVMEVALFAYQTEVQFSREWVSAHIRKQMKVIPHPEGYPPLDLVIYRALKRGYIGFNEGIFTIPYRRREKYFAYGVFLNELYKKYFNRWSLVAQFFVSLDKNGHPQKQSLRQISTVTTNEIGYWEAQELFEEELKEVEIGIFQDADERYDKEISSSAPSAKI